MEAVTMKEYGQVITGLINRENLTKEESKEMFMEILGDRQTPMQQGASWPPSAPRARPPQK